MAKKKRGRSSDFNKAQVIRDFKSQNPTMKPAQISEALTAQYPDREFKTTYISTLLSSDKSKPAKGAKGKRAAGGRSARGPRGAEGNVDFDALMKAKKLVDELGVERAKQAMSALTKLLD